jgi:uncharacterized protein (DUF58 family)
VLLLLPAAPLLALGTWLPGLQWVAVAYVLLALALFGLEYRLAGRAARFRLARQNDARLSLGVNNAISLSLYNPDLRPLTIWVRDEAPDAFGIDRRILSGKVPPHSLWRDAYHVCPLNRGDYQFGDLILRWLGPMGLLARQARLPAAAPVKVFPNLADIRRYDLLLKRNRLQEMGLRHTRQFGEGDEFERLREYLPDDEFRRIHWKASARRRRPITVEYETERSQNILPVLDIGRMMQSPVDQIAKLDYVINAALLLGYVATGKGDRVGLMTFADRVVQYLSPREGRAQFYRMLEALYNIRPQAVEPDYAAALSYLALKQRKRALVVLFTDVSSGTSINTLVGRAVMLSRQNLLLVVTISDPDVHAASRQHPSNSTAVYQRAAAEQLLDERRVLLDSLRRRGVLTLDVPANELSIAVINQYLEMKGRMLI